MKRIACLMLALTLTPVSSVFAADFTEKMFNPNENLRMFAEKKLSDVKHSLGEKGKYTVLVLDKSSSMSGEAMTALKNAAVKFCSSYLSENKNNRIALVAYDEDADAYKDFTDDVDKLAMAINSLEADGMWSNINAALEKADSLLQESSSSSKNIVLMTDGVPNFGEHKNSGKYTKDDYNINQNGETACFEYANSVYETAERISEYYNIYTIGFFHSTYGAEKKFSSRLMNDISNTGYIEVVDPDKLSDAFGSLSGELMKKTGEFYYPYNFATAKGHGTYYYSDSYFTEDASNYNPHLATMSLCFELASWPNSYGRKWTTDTEDPYAKFRTARELLIGTGMGEDKGLGYNTFAVSSDWGVSPSEDTFAALCAKKEITTIDGDYTLIALGLRGGGYGAEWCSNFTAGKEGPFKGFTEAKEKTLEFLKKYISDNNISGKVKLWVVGYSRGGAVANILAGDIDNGYKFPNDVVIDKKDLYAYTFEAPAAALKEEVRGDYSNIHNIVNPNDLVTLVAPRVWGFARYNDDIYLPSAYTTENFEEKKSKMLNQLMNLTGCSVSDYLIQETCTQPDLKVDLSKITSGLDDIYWWEPHEMPTAQALNEAIDYVAKNIIDSREEYCQNYEQGVRALFADSYLGDEKIDKMIEGVQETISEDDLLELISPIWVINLESVDKRLEKVRENVVEFVDKTVAEYELPLTDKTVEYVTNVAVDFLLDVAEGCLTDNSTDTINKALRAFSLVKNGSMVQAHYPEVCLAWLMSQDSYYNESVR